MKYWRQLVILMAVLGGVALVALDSPSKQVVVNSAPLEVPAHVVQRNQFNVIFMLADDLGYGDLGCFGAPDIQTPNLDRMAAEGVRMTDCYANASICSPTRLAFITGRYQQRLGLEWAVSYGVFGEGMIPGEPSVAGLMKSAGYQTAMSGKWHLGYDDDRVPNAHGFDRYFGLLGGNHHYFEHYDRKNRPDLFRDREAIEMEGYSTDLIADHAIQYIREMADQPFFLYVPFNAPHFPYQGPGDAEREVTPKKGWQTGSRETYIAMVESLDAAVGRILAALDEAGQAGRTLVVFTSDNGGTTYSRNAPLAKGKGTLWEGGIRVPTIARFPGRIPAGSVSTQVSTTFDWTATFVEMARVDPPKDRAFDGIDLLPILSRQLPEQERLLFWRRTLDPYRKNVEEHRAVRFGKWKYIDQPTGERFLFDLSRDIGETTNVIESQPRIAAELLRRIDAWEEAVGHETQFKGKRK